jgi:hypothetical protein
MAKTKGKNIILGILVIFVWGLIAYKVLSYFKDGSNIELPNSNPIKSAGIKVKKEKFRIDASYSDPFLKEVKVKSSSTRGNQGYNDYQGYQPTKVQVNWPEIVYGGIIETTDKNSRIGLLKIKNSNFLVKTQDSVMNVRVLYVYKDSINLRYSNEVKTYTTKLNK